MAVTRNNNMNQSKHGTGPSPKIGTDPRVLTLEAANADALSQRALEVLDTSGQAQVYIAIVGAPGSGKSTVAQKISDHINKVRDNDKYSIVIPMDGYHITQKELRNMASLGDVIGDKEATPGEFTTFDDLMRRRGAPWTFDPKQLHADLSAAKITGTGSFPAYDRKISDPVPDQICVTQENRIVFCEGNYMIAFDDKDWKPLESLWEDKWFIDVPESTLINRLVNRHLKNWSRVKVERFGEGKNGAMAKVEQSDIKHARWVVDTSRKYANVLVSNG